MKMPLIIAHREGRYWKGSEFSYIEESIKEGADIIELDVKGFRERFSKERK